MPRVSLRHRVPGAAGVPGTSPVSCRVYCAIPVTCGRSGDARLVGLRLRDGRVARAPRAAAAAASSAARSASASAEDRPARGACRRPAWPTCRRRRRGGARWRSAARQRAGASPTAPIAPRRARELKDSVFAKAADASSHRSFRVGFDRVRCACCTIGGSRRKRRTVAIRPTKHGPQADRRRRSDRPRTLISSNHGVPPCGTRPRAPRRAPSATCRRSSASSLLCSSRVDMVVRPRDARGSSRGSIFMCAASCRSSCSRSRRVFSLVAPPAG